MTDSFNPAAGFAPSAPDAHRDSPIAGLFAALAEGDATSHRYLLLLRFAVLKGTDVDQPRNLAKSVTVE